MDYEGQHSLMSDKISKCSFLHIVAVSTALAVVQPGNCSC